MNGAFKRAVVGGGVLLLAVSSTQCAYYYDLTGRDIVLRKPSEAPKAPLAAGTAPPEEGMEERYERGLSSLERGEYEEAAADFLTVFSQDPSYREVEKKLIQAQRLIRKVPVEREILEAAEYTIGLGDILDVSVWQWPDLTMPSVIVRPDGKISFPLVGDVQAEGLTLTALDAVLTGRLEEFIKAPEVSVSIAQFGGRKVIVLGEVGSQGVYAPTGKTSVLEVVALAGGFRPSAVTGSVILIRQEPEQTTLYRLNLKSALRHGNLRDNIEVASNDILFVPKRFITNLTDFAGQIAPIAGTTLSTNAVLKDYDVDLAGRE